MNRKSVKEILEKIDRNNKYFEKLKKIRKQRNSYYRKYYQKNREELLEYAKEKQREYSKKMNKPKRLRALKSWRTRIEKGFYVKNWKERLEEYNKEINELEKNEKRF